MAFFALGDFLDLLVATERLDLDACGRGFALLAVFAGLAFFSVLAGRAALLAVGRARPLLRLRSMVAGVPLCKSGKFRFFRL